LRRNIENSQFMIRVYSITILIGAIILFSSCAQENVFFKDNEEEETVNSSNASEIEKQVVKIVNDERAKLKLASLKIDESLMKSCDIRAMELLTKFSHDRPDGTSCFTAIEIPYKAAAENIAAGQNSSEDVMKSWMNSDGHRKNILGESYTHLGVGCYEYGNKLYWVQLFIQKK
jgi:Uncharacterized protein with SCP/PR1 domains